MGKPKLLAALVLMLELSLAAPVFCLTPPASPAAEMNAPLTPGSCHSHHHPAPHIPRPQHLCCYAGHPVPTAAVQSISIVLSAVLVAYTQVRASAAGHDKPTGIESVVSASPPFPNQVLRI
jgi:hypothetical protein